MANTKENEEMNADLSVDELKSVTGGFGGSGNLGGGVGGGGFWPIWAVNTHKVPVQG